MNTINLKIKNSIFRLLRLLFLLAFLGCDATGVLPLTIKNIELCDNFDAQANCTEPKPIIGVVKLKPTSNEKEKLTWENFSNYLYFTARETPGFVITFSRDFTQKEKSSFQSNYVAYLTVSGVRERMEGFEIGEKKLASFHYLGSLLKEVKRHEQTIKEKPDLTKLGTLLLQFEFTLPDGFTNSIQRELKMEWEK